MPIDDRSDRPIFQQIADELRARITSGTYPPGAQLPSETDLIAEFGVTRLTVRRGLAVLANEGLTEPHRGKGVFVRERPAVLTVRNTRFRRSDRAAGKGALAAEAEAAGLTWSSEQLELAMVDVAGPIAEVLGESRAFARRRRMIVDGVPTQLADSYIPESIDAEIGSSRGANAPGGIYGLLEQHGHRIMRYREELRVRSATPEESVALELPLAAPVVLLVRHAIDQDGRVVEYFDSVAAGDRHRYVYEWEAPDD
ncbi:MAG: GntR family transcriptional regulator [Pseudonocardiales bacterium]|nr:MAG: GntR family transcriptional regulator [Pseudonocardiales bacterium]